MLLFCDLIQNFIVSLLKFSIVWSDGVAISPLNKDSILHVQCKQTRFYWTLHNFYITTFTAVLHVMIFGNKALVVTTL